MAVFRVPYPSDPRKRRALFERGLSKLAGLGSCEGDENSGQFCGSSPVGELKGIYHAPPGASEIEIEITKKPFYMPLSMIESAARGFLDSEIA
jgi:hypothetical protein